MPRVGEDLRDCVLRRRRLLALVGAREVLDVIARMVSADVLQRVGDALDQVFLCDGGHVESRQGTVRQGAKYTHSAFSSARAMSRV